MHQFWRCWTFFIKSWIFYEYCVTTEDKSFKGILDVKSTHKETHKETQRDFAVFSCYLPPENPTSGRDASSFFAHSLSQIYFYSDCDS